MGIHPHQYYAMQARLSRGRQRVPAGDSVGAVAGDAVEREADLHAFISDFCRERGWLAFHGSMAHKAMRTLGEPDYTILADKGRVFLIEAKSKTGKLRREQLGLAKMAEKLGHKIHVVRSFKEFMEAVS
jgi:hypothetical protein